MTNEEIEIVAREVDEEIVSLFHSEITSTEVAKRILTALDQHRAEKEAFWRNAGAAMLEAAREAFPPSPIPKEEKP